MWPHLSLVLISCYKSIKNHVCFSLFIFISILSLCCHGNCFFIYIFMTGQQFPRCQGQCQCHRNKVVLEVQALYSSEINQCHMICYHRYHNRKKFPSCICIKYYIRTRHVSLKQMCRLTHAYQVWNDLDLQWQSYAPDKEIQTPPPLPTPQPLMKVIPICRLFRRHKNILLPYQIWITVPSYLHVSHSINP